MGTDLRPSVFPEITPLASFEEFQTQGNVRELNVETNIYLFKCTLSPCVFVNMFYCMVLDYIE